MRNSSSRSTLARSASVLAAARRVFSEAVRARISSSRTADHSRRAAAYSPIEGSSADLLGVRDIPSCRASSTKPARGGLASASGPALSATNRFSSLSAQRVPNSILESMVPKGSNKKGRLSLSSRGAELARVARSRAVLLHYGVVRERGAKESSPPGSLARRLSGHKFSMEPLQAPVPALLESAQGPLDAALPKPPRPAAGGASSDVVDDGSPGSTGAAADSPSHPPPPCAPGDDRASLSCHGPDAAAATLKSPPEANAAVPLDPASPEMSPAEHDVLSRSESLEALDHADELCEFLSPFMSPLEPRGSAPNKRSRPSTPSAGEPDARAAHHAARPAAPRLVDAGDERANFGGQNLGCQLANRVTEQLEMLRRSHLPLAAVRDLRILLVASAHDNANALALLTDAIRVRNPSCKIETACNSGEARRCVEALRLRQQRYALVVIDLALPNGENPVDLAIEVSSLPASLTRNLTATITRIWHLPRPRARTAHTPQARRAEHRRARPGGYRARV